MPSALQKIADILPLTQGLKVLKATSLGLPLESVWFPIAIMAVVAVVCGGLAIRFFQWE
jgi:ABC-2 type transport system permease protein